VPLPQKIKVAFYGESWLLLNSLSEMLRKESDITCSVATASCGAWPNQPEVIVIAWQDATEPNFRRLSTDMPNARVVVMDADAGPLNIVRCVRLGVMGFTLKNSRLTDVAETIRSVADGNRVIPGSLALKMSEQLYSEQNYGHRLVATGSRGLTQREQEIARLVAEGLGNQQIADKLSIQCVTVKSHIHTILQKLNCRNRTELARVYWEQRQRPGLVAASSRTA
jgi:DNA-binding NarL/FixJ family response regulator